METHATPGPMQCSAKRSNGEPCKAKAIRGGTVCRMHGGAAPQVKQKAMERILAAADPAAAELVRLAKEAESESVRLQAIKDLLDRAGFGATQKHELTTIKTHEDALAELD